MLICIFYSQVVESSSLDSILFREAISHPYISFFSFTGKFFSVTSFLLFRRPLTYITLVGGIGGQGGIKIVSAKNNQLIIRNDLILVHAVQLKPTTKNGIYWCKCCDHFSILRVNPYEEVNDDNDENDTAKSS